MGFPTRKFDGYKPIPLNTIRNDIMCLDEDATRFANNAIALHRFSGRNIAAGVGFTPDDNALEDITFTIVGTSNVGVVINSLPMDQRYTGASGRIRAWVYMKHSDADGKVSLYASLGRHSGSAGLPTSAATWQWVPVNLDVDPVFNPGQESQHTLSVTFSSSDDSYSDTDIITVRSVSIGEVPDPRHDAPAFVDTSNAACKLFAQDDWPLSAAAYRILANNMNACLLQRLPRANLFNHCYRQGRISPVGTSYGADYDRAGRWMLRKAGGVTRLDFVVRARIFTATVRQTLRASLYSPYSIAYDNQSANFTAGDIVVGQTSGAWARILADADAGTTGVLALGYIEGTFQNNETIIDEGGGTALVNGTVAGQVAIANVEMAPIAGDTGWATGYISGLVDGAAEYELRADGKSSVAGDDLRFTNLAAVEHNTAKDDNNLPNSWHTEQDDDVMTLEWRRIAETLEQVWFENTQILLNDHMRVETWMAGSYAGPVRFWNDTNWWTDGDFGATLAVIWPSRHTKRIRIKASLIRSGEAIHLPFAAGGSGSYFAGEQVSGSVSGFTGYVEEADIANQLSVSQVKGMPISGEDVTGALSGAVWTTDEPPSPFQVPVYAVVVASDGDTDNGSYLSKKTLQFNNSERRVPAELSFSLPVAELYRNSLALNGEYPYRLLLTGYSTDRGDHLVLDKWVAYEEPVLSGSLVATEEDAL
jgi:hypothetical protein